MATDIIHITDLSEETKNDYLTCLEEWSDEVQVVVTALTNGWCSAINGMIERARRISSEFGNKVIYREIDTSTRTAVREWGLSDGLFVNERSIYKGPPLSYEQIKKIIGKKVRK